VLFRSGKKKGWAEPVKSAPKKTASKPAGKEKS